MRKLFAIILVCAMLLVAAMPMATASADNTVQPRYTYIVEARADIEVSILGVASCSGSLTTRTSNPVKITIRLQESDGSNWMTIKKWEITDTGGVSATKDYAIYSGSSYRVHVTGYVYDDEGNVLESATVSRYIDF